MELKKISLETKGHSCSTECREIKCYLLAVTGNMHPTAITTEERRVVTSMHIPDES